jgi:hypothetical protein
LFFEKNVDDFAENCQKLQKILIITSIPGLTDWANFLPMGNCLLLRSFFKVTKVDQMLGLLLSSVARLGEFSHIGWLLIWAGFLKITEVAQIFVALYPMVQVMY